MKKAILYLLSAVMIIGCLTVSPRTSKADGFAGGSGSKYAPYLIENKEQLALVEDDLAACYRLTADIELEEADFERGALFEYIGFGRGAADGFTGVFDGNGYTIRGLRSDKVMQYVGLFGKLSGTVKNVILEDCELRSTMYDVYVGGIAAWVDGGTIENCSVSGNISGWSASTDSKNAKNSTGGIAGYAREAVIKGCASTAEVSSKAMSAKGDSKSVGGGIVGSCVGTRIEACINRATVQAYTGGSLAFSGGVAGEVSSIGGTNSEIISCANTGIVTAESTTLNAIAGGIAGYGAAEVSKCYNLGSIYAKTSSAKGGVTAGGIFGNTQTNGGVEYLSIENCYSTGEVKTIPASGSIQSTAGGVIGILDKGGFAGECYSIGDVTAQTATVTNAGGAIGYRFTDETDIDNIYFLSGKGGSQYGGTALSAAQMEQQASFAGFDFSTIWTIRSENYLFPQLLGQEYNTFDSPKGGDEPGDTPGGTPDPVSEEKIARLFGDEDIIRSSGDGRYDTAIATADYLKTAMGVDRFSAVVIACGTNFPDALAGSYLAVREKAPILLIGGNGKGAALTTDYVRNNLVPGGRVWILGGESAVPAQSEEMLAAEGFEVIRLAGKNRYETNLMILEAAGGAPSRVLIADGTNFADALSASALGLPILLVNKKNGRLTDAQKAYLRENNFSSVEILGGTSAVADTAREDIEEALPIASDRRLAGDNRYQTSIAIANEFFPNPAAITLATGVNFPDGLTGGSLAYGLNAPLILTRAKNVDLAQGYAKAAGVSRFVVFGGESALPSSVIATVAGK